MSARDYDREAAELARRYRKAETDGARAAIMLGVANGGGFCLEVLEALLAQHAEMMEALEDLRDCKMSPGSSAHLDVIAGARGDR